MKLDTIYNVCGGIVTVSNEMKPNICTKVKITGKAKQNAQNKRENIENQFMKLASIENKKSKKANFFNKHKNK